MKDRILNGLMLVTVAAALFLTLIRGAPDVETAFDAPVVSYPTAAPTVTPHPADLYRQRRVESRQLERSMLQTLIDSEYTAPETRLLAQEQMMETARQMETELAVEAALAGKGYGEALCVVRENTVTVMTGTELTAADAALLLDIIREASGAAPENIRMTGF